MPAATRLPDPPSFRRRLLRWFGRRRRDLPWRGTRDPYAVVVSEFMLQQTQVATVIPYYERFLKRFPNARSLAKADEAEVLRLWAGLGYYRRARQLHRFARQVVAKHDGRVPADHDTLLNLPGLGPYAAAAVASIAFDLPYAVLDGNVIRVMARVLRDTGDPGSGETKRRLRDAAQRLLAPRRPGDFNQAMMELGAVVCRPRAPKCDECPLRASCGAFAEGRPEAYPSPKKRRATVRLQEWGAILLRRGKVLLLQRPAAARWGGMWEFPHGLVEADEDLAGGVARVAKALAGLRVEDVEPGPKVRYTFTHHHFEMRCGVALAPAGRVKTPEHETFRWVRPDELADFALPSAGRRVARWLTRREGA